jgi:cysteine sulfinate desulfinase/cysteine desulfurase-like protein
MECGQIIPSRPEDGDEPWGIVSFAVEGIESEIIEARLRAEGINLSTSSAPSTLLDATARGLPPLVAEIAGG